MNKIISFLRQSNRYKHLIGGILLGLGANDWYCAEYTTATVAAAMEMKDELWGGKWDWIDFALTLIGGNFGYLIRFLIFDTW